ncbi:MAG: TlpA disulfide reductase family protein [Candidatus Omnitrophota bacterium]
MKKYLAAIFTITFVSLAGISCIQAQDNKAQDFTLQDLNQNTVSLSEYKGNKPVVLFFWTTWCPYCQRELVILKDKYAGFAGRGLEFLAINIGEDKRRVENLVRKKGLTFKVLLDKDGTVSDSFGIFGVPTYIFIDKKGNIVEKENYFSEKAFENLISE